MRRLSLALSAAVALLFVAPASASDKLVGTIVAPSASRNNLTTASTFTLAKRGKYAVQCDIAAYVCEGTDSSLTATTTGCVKVAAGQLFDIPLSYMDDVIAIVPATAATATCPVFAVTP